MTGTYQQMPIDQILATMPEVARWVQTSSIEVPIEAPGERAPSIHRAAMGPLTASSSHELVPLTSLPIWDVNGYYRAVGIGWPYHPTRAELRRAYQARDGANDDYATYALKRLLDREFRVHYDARPAGEPVDDTYRWQRLKREGAKWARAETARTGRVHDFDDFAGDVAHKIRHHEDAPQPPTGLLRTIDWPFGYYLWGSRSRAEDTLSQWQSMLLSALWAYRLSAAVAVGYVGHLAAPAVRVHHQNIDILFLNDQQTISPELANAAALTFLQTPPGTALSEPLLITLPEEPRMTDESPLDFATGGQEAAAAHKAEAAARKARFGNDIYLTALLKNDGDAVILRFLMDEDQWIETKQHNYVKTKPAPKDKPADRTWPETMGAVCRYTPVGARENRRPAYSDCYICDNTLDDKGRKPMAGTRMWALAAVREEVIGDEEMAAAGLITRDRIGKRIGLVDAHDEVDEIDEKGNSTGKKVLRKRIVIVNMAMQNFCEPLFTLAKYHETLLDRDYVIVRRGEAKSTKVAYDPIALPPVEMTNSEGKTEIYDLREEKYAALYQGKDLNDRPKLIKMISNRCSKEFYDRYFDVRVEVSWRSDDDDSPSTTTAASTAATSEPTGGSFTQDQLQAMRAKIMEANPVGSSS